MELAEEHRSIRETARRFADATIRPVANQLDEQERFPAEIYDKLAELGLFGITLPDACGGGGGDPIAYALVMEELSRGYASIADQVGLVELVGTLLHTYGTPAQQERYLLPLLRAERRCAYALTEPEAGSDLASVRTQASHRGEGWVLEGGKVLIHNAPVCDFAVVLARSESEGGSHGLSIFLVDRSRPGVSVGPKEHKMGQRASQVGSLTFERVELGADALLGEENRGFQIMMSLLDKGRVGIAALAVGILQAALECAVEYAKARHQFGRSISEFQGVQWMLADMAKDTHAARLMTHAAAARLLGGERATLEASMAKCFAADAAVTHTSNAVQVFGGSGYIRGTEVERLYRDAKITQIYEGTSQIQRMIIARMLLA